MKYNIGQKVIVKDRDLLKSVSIDVDVTGIIRAISGCNYAVEFINFTSGRLHRCMGYVKNGKGFWIKENEVEIYMEKVETKKEPIKVTPQVAEFYKSYEYKTDKGNAIYKLLGDTSSKFMKDNNITYTELVDGFENGYVVDYVINVGDVVFFKNLKRYYEVSSSFISESYVDSQHVSMDFVHKHIDQAVLIIKAEDIKKDGK